MSATKRETWGSLRKLPSGRWQARYPGPDGQTYTARTDADKALTFLAKTDARTWLSIWRLEHHRILGLSTG